MLLALDTSGPFCSVAVADEERILVSRSEEIGRGHAERLMPMIEEILREAKLEWAQFNKIACTTGPGSFTGLRVGIATARGLALALNCPCIGVSVFEAMAFDQPMPLAVLMDAKRDQVWLQLFNEEGKTNGEPLAVAVDEVATFIPSLTHNLIGSGTAILAVEEQRYTKINDAPSPPIEGVVAIANMRNDQAKPPKPLYLRAPDAKPQQPSVLK